MPLHGNYPTHPRALRLCHRGTAWRGGFSKASGGPGLVLCSAPSRCQTCREDGVKKWPAKKHEIWAEILGVEFFLPETPRTIGRSAPKNPRPKFRVKFRVVAFQNPRRVRCQKSACSEANLVTRIAATSKSQIASDCNRNSKKSLRLRKHPLKPTLWTREPPVLCGFCSISEAPHGSANPPKYVATTRV